MGGKHVCGKETRTQFYYRHGDLVDPTVSVKGTLVYYTSLKGRVLGWPFDSYIRSPFLPLLICSKKVVLFHVLSKPSAELLHTFLELDLRWSHSIIQNNFNGSSANAVNVFISLSACW